MHRGLSGGRRQQSGQSAGGRRQQSGQSAGGGSRGVSPLGGLSRSSGGSFPLRSARLRLLRASLGAGRCSSSGFGCSPLLGLLGFGRRWAASLCFASLRHPSPRHPSRSVCLRPPRFRSAAPLRPPLPPPLPPSASSSRLRCCPLPPKLLPLCIVSRVTFILHCFTWNILHCFT